MRLHSGPGAVLSTCDRSTGTALTTASGGGTVTLAVQPGARRVAAGCAGDWLASSRWPWSLCCFGCLWRKHQDKGDLSVVEDADKRGYQL